MKWVNILLVCRYGTHSNFTLYKMDYVKLYVDTVRETVKKYDLRPFIVSSPTNGIESEAEGFVAQSPGSNLYGDGELTELMYTGWQINSKSGVLTLFV